MVFNRIKKITDKISKIKEPIENFKDEKEQWELEKLKKERISLEKQAGIAKLKAEELRKIRKADKEINAVKKLETKIRPKRKFGFSMDGLDYALGIEKKGGIHDR